MNNLDVLRHIVMFQFKNSAGNTEIVEIIKRFTKLEELIDEVVDLECGINNSPENLNEGLTHCFTLTFNGESDRDAYLEHPKHVEFADWVGAWVEKVVVLDYSVEG